MAASPRAGQAPGIVKIRLSGAIPDIAAAPRLLGCDAVAGTGVDLIEVSPPYPNRRDAGARLYLTIRLAADPPRAGTQPGRAVARQLTDRENS